MTKKQKGILIFAGMLVALMGGFYTYRLIERHTGHGHETLIEYYTCAMHPQIIKDKPGNCPICGMRLIKKTRFPTEEVAQVSEELRAISLSPLKQVLANVATTVVEKKELTKTIRTVAIVAFDRKLFVAQQEYVSALRLAHKTGRSGFSGSARQAATLVASSREKLKLLGMSDAEIDKLARDKKPDVALYFPKAGGDVWINAEIYEFERAFLSPGEPVRVFVDAYPGEPFTGIVAAITPVVDPVARTFKARVRIESPERDLYPEMFASAKIRVALGKKLAIPASAVINTGTRSVVWVEIEPGRYRPRMVQLGARVDGFFVVRDGLVEGERVVSQGGFLLDSEAELTAFGEGDGMEKKGHHHH